MLPRDGLDEDDEMILVVDSSSEMPGRTLDYGNRPAESAAGDLERKSSVDRESPPVRNIVLGKPTKLNESLECDDEDGEDCAINKFSLEGEHVALMAIPFGCYCDLLSQCACNNILVQVVATLQRCSFPADSFFQLASFISSFALLLFIILFFFICFIICKRSVIGDRSAY